MLSRRPEQTGTNSGYYILCYICSTCGIKTRLISHWKSVEQMNKFWYDYYNCIILEGWA